MNYYEILSRVHDHLMTQKKRCIRGNVCLYRSYDGQKACAIGALIDQEYYNEEWNSLPLSRSVVREALTNSGMKIDKHKDIYFLQALQRVHDNYSVHQWKKQFMRLADEWTPK